METKFQNAPFKASLDAGVEYAYCTWCLREFSVLRRTPRRDGERTDPFFGRRRYRQMALPLRSFGRAVGTDVPVSEPER